MGKDDDGFTTHRIELGAGPIRYRERGEGRPVVFVHGFAVDSRLWDGTARLLPPGLRCILPDWPLGSHREAMRPEADITFPGMARMLGDFLDALDLEDVVLVGNDSGGAICQIHVTERPTRVGGLVLTNTDCFENLPPAHFKVLARMMRLPGASAAFAHSMRLGPIRRSSLAYGALTESPIDESLLRDWTEPQVADRGVRRDSTKFFASADNRHTLRAAERFGDVRVPTSIVWGTGDRFFTIEHGRRLAEAIPGARLVEVPGGRTFLPLDRPEEVAREIASLAGPPEERSR